MLVPLPAPDTAKCMSSNRMLLDGVVNDVSVMLVAVVAVDVVVTAAVCCR